LIIIELKDSTTLLEANIALILAGSNEKINLEMIISKVTSEEDSWIFKKILPEPILTLIQTTLNGKSCKKDLEE